MADQAIKMQLSLVRDEASAHIFLEDWYGTAATDTEARNLLVSLGDLDNTELVPHQNELVMQMLDLGLRTSSLLLSRNWAIVKCPTDGPGLALSDSPFRLIEHPQNHRPMTGVGLATADEIWLPLDRHTLLIMRSNPGTADTVIHLDSERRHRVPQPNDCRHRPDRSLLPPRRRGRCSEARLPRSGPALRTGLGWLADCVDRRYEQSSETPTPSPLPKLGLTDPARAAPQEDRLNPMRSASLTSPFARRAERCSRWTPTRRAPSAELVDIQS